MSNPIDLDAIRARAEAATPGPWETDVSDEDIEVNAGTARTIWNEAGTSGLRPRSWRTTDRILEVQDAGLLDEDAFEQVAANAEFIAHAREDVPALLLYIERLHARIEFMEEQEAGLRDDIASIGRELRAEITGLHQMLDLMGL